MDLPLHAAATSAPTPAAILNSWRKAGGDETTPIWRRNADTRVKQAALYGEAEKRKGKSNVMPPSWIVGERLEEATRLLPSGGEMLILECRRLLCMERLKNKR